LRAAATFQRQRLVDWLRQDGPWNPEASSIGSELVSRVTFEDVLADVRFVDLLHLDAEGYDLELLTSSTSRASRRRSSASSTLTCRARTGTRPWSCSRLRLSGDPRGVRHDRVRGFSTRR
jgi:hypothetical protein